MPLLPLNPEEILPHLPIQGIGSSVVFLEEVSSTNTYLLDLPAERSPHGMVVIAENQIAGKGRHGRTWLAFPCRNITFSIVLRSHIHPGGLVTLAAATAVTRVLRDLPVMAGIKWPNDIVTLNSGQKLCGILCEARQEASGSLRLVLGIGLNVNLGVEDLPDEIRTQATSLQILLGHTLNRNALLVALLDSIGKTWTELAQDGGVCLIQTARSLCVTLGCEVRMDLNGQVIEGTAVDLDPQGRLVLRLPGGIHRVVEIGEIQTIRKMDQVV